MDRLQISFIAQIGASSKKGLGIYRQTISSLTRRLYRLENDQRELTVWEKLRKHKGRVENGV